ncbi:hypothetical protein HF072_07255 [Bacillus sp. RO3]|nr:hypothetical protein [Bacillus sp. RO3]
MTEFEKHLLSVREVFINFPNRIQKLEQDLKKADMEIMDLMHVIEFKSLNAFEGFKLCKQVQEARRRRRAIKDELDFFEPIKSLLSTAGKPSDHHINKTIGSVRKIEMHHKTRTYKMRVRKDLQKLIKEVNE